MYNLIVSILLQLSLNQVPVPTLSLYQLVVATGLHYCSLVHDQNHVCIADGREPMRHRDDGWTVGRS